jgi:hypothetical protein
LKELDEATFLEVLTVYLRRKFQEEVEAGVDIIIFFERENSFSNQTEKPDVRLQRIQFQSIKKK